MPHIQRMGLKFKTTPYSDTIYEVTLPWDEFVALSEKHNIDTNKTGFRYNREYMTWDEFMDENNRYARMATITYIPNPKFKKYAHYK